MKKYLPIVTIILIIGLLIFLSNSIYALSTKENTTIIDNDEIYSIDVYNNNKFTYTSAPTLNTKITKDSGMDSIISNVAGIVGYLCAAAAVIVIIVKGVQFMNASPDGKAEIKKQMIAIVIGATMVFAITQILRIISNVTSNLF